VKTIAAILTALVALEHLGFLGLEMFAWTLPLGQRGELLTQKLLQLGKARGFGILHQLALCAQLSRVAPVRRDQPQLCAQQQREEYRQQDNRESEQYQSKRHADAREAERHADVGAEHAPVENHEHHRQRGCEQEQHVDRLHADVPLIFLRRAVPAAPR